jgi:hypothetical protein
MHFEKFDDHFGFTSGKETVNLTYYRSASRLHEQRISDKTIGPRRDVV